VLSWITRYGRIGSIMSAQQLSDVQPIGVWLRICDRQIYMIYIADFLADKSADRSVWIRMGKLRIDRPYLTDMENN
jgi:hypothetical protein